MILIKIFQHVDVAFPNSTIDGKISMVRSRIQRWANLFDRFDCFKLFHITEIWGEKLKKSRDTV